MHLSTPLIQRFLTTTRFNRLGFVFFKLLALLWVLSPWPSVLAYTLPPNFDNIEVINSLSDPDGLAFSPDGRMFISERITGRLRVAVYDKLTDLWSLNPTPFHTFDIPKENGVPTARRSAGLRDIAFDPNFTSNGYIYAFYMSDTDLQNRVVRIVEDSVGSNESSGIETLIIHLPFNTNGASGSHNGGAIEFGKANDSSITEELFISTGDGWEGTNEGDPVQSLSSFTGKILRINKDGTIPTDNPFYNNPNAVGDFRTIFALGLRNPYSMSRHPDTRRLYINDARGSNKANIHLVEAAANYGHEIGAGTPIGNPTGIWVDAANAGGELVTGGAWMPEAGIGNFPASYNGAYFTALWGGNSETTGNISFIQSRNNTSVTLFESGVGELGANGIRVKPVTTRIGPEGDLYYLLTTYTTGSGAVRRVKYTSQETVSTPVFSPLGGNTANAVNVTISTTTGGASIYYTTDNSPPTESSTLYVATPISISTDTILKARAYKESFNDSAISSENYLIGLRSNLPPNVNAGPDKTVFVNQNVTLDGSGSTDSDGDDDFLTDELWTLLSGPPITIADATEEIASFVPTQTGVYQFQLDMSDGIDSASDTVIITVVEPQRVSDGLQALYTFEEGSGTLVNDISGVAPAANLDIDDLTGLSWIGTGGVIVTDDTLISGADTGDKIFNACTTSNAISLEAWIAPTNTTQTGPKRILSFSTDLFNRNFTLGQQGDLYDTRLRTSTTSNNGVPSLTVPEATVSTELSHVLYTRNSSGLAKIYVNGVAQAEETIGGNFSNWSNSSAYKITLANELTNDRGWLGSMYLAAIYCEALSDEDVEKNYSAGTPPYTALTDSDSDGVFDPFDNCVDDSNAEQENVDGDALGDICDNDADNDGVLNLQDDEELDVKLCRDLDADSCDDCAIGVDGFGPPR